MKKVFVAVAVSVVTGVLLAGSLAGTALAWHPKGKIQKWVQNMSVSGSTKQDANDEVSAVSANPNDTLKYIIRIWNEGEPHQAGHNDMVDIVMTDTLPAGVELVSDPSKRELKEAIDRLRPGDEKFFEYTVKVTKQENGVIKNTACFTGDSEVKDAPQKGCDDANIKVTKPQILPVTTTPPAALPVTGTGSVLGLFAGATSVGYLAHRFVTRKR